jgi:hypothetical protein
MPMNDFAPSRRDDAVRLRDILRGVHSAGKMLAGLALALLAWGASQIYADLKAPQPSSVVASAP